MRDASGNITDLVNNTLTDCKETYSCKFGLFNSYSVSFTLIALSVDLFTFPKLDSDVAVNFLSTRGSCAKLQLFLHVPDENIDFIDLEHFPHYRYSEELLYGYHLFTAGTSRFSVDVSIDTLAIYTPL